VGAYPFGMLPDCACFECGSRHGATPMPLAALKLSAAPTNAGITAASVAGGLAAALLARVAAGAHGPVARRATLDAALGTGTS
ncbi:hypothetical protein D6U55_19385, partial [Vibrio cholerae]|nr:hypothetical protein [Vibrio cholerae]